MTAALDGTAASVAWLYMVQLCLSRCSFTVLCWWCQNADQLKTWTEKEVTVVVHREEEAKEKLERKQEITTTTPPHRKESLRRHPGEYLGNISTQHEKYVQVFLYEKMWQKSNTLKIDEMKPKLFDWYCTKKLDRIQISSRSSICGQNTAWPVVLKGYHR